MTYYTNSHTNIIRKREANPQISSHMHPVGSLVHDVQVTLQHDTLEGVVAGDFYYGSTIGRVCNRIVGAAFSGESPSPSTGFPPKYPCPPPPPPA